MCTPEENELRKKNQATIEKFFRREDYKIDEFMMLFTEDTVWELPWTDPLLQWVGQAQVREHFINSRKNVQEWKFINPRVAPALDPNKFFVEVEATATFVQPGAPPLIPKMPNRYIFIFTMQDGKIKHAGEYFDRFFAMKALGMEVPEFRGPKMGNPAQ